MNLTILSGNTSKNEIKLQNYGGNTDTCYCFVDLFVKHDYKSVLRDKKTGNILLDSQGNPQKGYNSDVITLKFNGELAKIIANNKPNGVSRKIQVTGSISTYTKNTNDCVAILPDKTISVKQLPFEQKVDRVCIDCNKVEFLDSNPTKTTTPVATANNVVTAASDLDNMIASLSTTSLRMKTPNTDNDSAIFGSNDIGNNPIF